MVESYHAGANSYVQKPIKFEEFGEALRRIAMYRLVHDQSPR